MKTKSSKKQKSYKAQIKVEEDDLTLKLKTQNLN